jgi:hypothetical protein
VLNVFRSGDKVLMDLRNRQTYQLNDVGATMWSLLDGTHVIEEITDLIIKEFDIDVETARTDVKAFLEELSSLGLIES